MNQQDKKKILLLSFYFPPCNITASQRMYSWAKYLKNYGFQPVVITRRWDYPIKSQIDAYRECGPEIIHEINDDYEIYFLPYKSNIRDKILVKYGEKRFSKVRRLLTLIEIISFNFTNFFLSYKNLYDFTLNYLKENNDVRILITSAYPFPMFRFAYKLKKKFTDLQWFADYRDLWTTRNDSLFIPKNTFWGKIRWKLEPRSEKKWLSNSTAFISISEKYIDIIGKFINKPGIPVFNGFMEEDYNINIDTVPNNIFYITYLGTLKSIQKIEVFLDAFEKVVRYFKDKVNIKLRFIGTAYEEDAADRLINYTKNYSENVLITKRIDRKKSIKMEMESQLLLLVSYSGGTGGGTGSKTYEYIGTRKPILLCPSDGAIMEDIIKKTGQGFYCNTSDEAYNLLVNLIDEHYKTGTIALPDCNDEARMFFSRKKQTEILATAINKFIE